VVPVLISLVLLFALGDRRDRGVPGIRVFLEDQGHPSPPSLGRESLDSLSPPLGHGAPEMILLLPSIPHYRVLLVVPGCLEGRGDRGALEDPVVRRNCSELSWMQVPSELSFPRPSICSPTKGTSYN